MQIASILNDHDTKNALEAIAQRAHNFADMNFAEFGKRLHQFIDNPPREIPFENLAIALMCLPPQGERK